MGALAMTPTKIQRIACSYWDANQHWGDSLAEQRADYIVGAVLLLLSFSLQLVGSLVPSTIEPAFLQPLGYIIVAIAAPVVVLLIGAVILRNLIATKTKGRVRGIQAEVFAAEAAELEARRKGG